jgi:predicted CXXCH cytochrome family protein
MKAASGRIPSEGGNVKADSAMTRTFLTILILLSSAVTIHAREYVGAKAPGQGITETSHDLKHQLGFENIDLCSWCHAPHGDMEQTNPPLWSQKDSHAGFTVYSQGTEERTDQPDEETAEALLYSPGPSSMICLSCHDGSNASNKYGFMSKIIGGASLESFSYSGYASVARLKDHPIGFKYQKSERSMVDLRTSSEQVTESFAVKDLLRQGRMECVSCHDVHNFRNEGEKFLWTSDARSNFCFTCHRK